MKQLLAIATLLALTLTLTGCPKLERDAYNITVASKAALVKFRANHPECGPFNPITGHGPEQFSALPCVANNRITSAKDIIIDAAEVYCSSPAFETGGTCSPPAKGTSAYQIAADKLNAAIRNYTQVEADFKGVFGR